MSGTEALYGTTGPESRDDCSRKRAGVGIAANLRAARRRRPSRVASVGQDPNSAAPVAHLSYFDFPDCKRAELWNFPIGNKLHLRSTVVLHPKENKEGAQCDTSLKALPRSKWRSVGCQMQCTSRRTEALACRQKRLANFAK